jgi:hypothetical protein
VTPRTGSEFAPGSKIELWIPSGTPGDHLDPHSSYRCYDIQNGSAGTITLDGSAYSVIDQLDVFHGSVHLSNIRQAGLLATMMMDASVSGDDRSRAYTAAGTGEFAVEGTLNAANIAAGVYARTGASIAPGESLKVAIAVPNLLGSLALRAIPVGMLMDALRLEIKLTTDGRDWGSSTVVNAADMGLLRVTNVRFHLQMVKLSMDTEAALLESQGVRLISPAMDYEHYSTTVAANSGRMSYQIPHRTRSVTAIFAVFRNNSTIGAANSLSLVNRTKPVSSYSFRIGSRRVPQLDVDCTGSATEAFLELQKAFGLVTLSETPTALPMSVYNSTGFVLGLALSAFNQTDVLADGVNTSAVNITFDAVLTNAVDITVDFFVAYEKTLITQQGLLRFAE